MSEMVTSELAPPVKRITFERVRDQKTSRLYYLVKIPINDGSVKELWLPYNESASKIASEIRNYTDVISADRSSALAQIDALLKACPTTELVGVTESGWHGDDSAFITPRWRRGPEKDRFLFRPDARGEAEVTQMAGSFKGFRRYVALPSRLSSCSTFAIMAALSGPMWKHSGMSEGCVFHLYGETTSGKTTVAKVGESVGRCPTPLTGWGQSLRKVEEIASGRHDQLLTLNAAEKARPKERANILHALTHGVAEGSGQGRSVAVSEWLPNLTSRSPVLSNGNQSGAAMARVSGLEWDRQEAARFISIPVPPAAEGGIIDRPNKKMSLDETRQLVEQIAAGAQANYGMVLPRWVMRVHRNRDRIPGLIGSFVRKAGIKDPYQVRIARKFGVVYAAGVIACMKDWMPWDEEFVFDVVSRVMERALKSIGEDLSPPKVVEALDRALQDRRRFPVLGKGRRLRIKKGRPLHGFRYRKAGLDYLAVRRESLPEVTGKSETSACLTHLLAKAGVLEKGHGGKLTQQVPFTLTTSEGDDRKTVRMLVVRLDKLQRALVGRE